MNRKVRTATVGLALLAAAQAALAIGFGRMPQSAVLGQPLFLSIPIHLDGNEELRSDCISAQVSYADVPQQPGTISMRLMPALPGQTQRMLRLVTTTRVSEPVVNVDLSIGCNGKISRHFTIFADPPLVDTDTKVAAAKVEPAAPAPAARHEAAASTQHDAATTSSGTSSHTTAASAPRRAAATPRRSRATAPTRTHRRAAAPRPSPSQDAPRLQVTPLDPAAHIAALAAAEEAEKRAQAAEAAASAASAAEATLQARLAQIEATNAALRAEAAKRQQELASLRAEIRQALRAPPSRDPSWLTALLVVLIALLLAALLWLWRQRAPMRGEERAWLRPEAAGAPGEVPAADNPRTTSAAAFNPMPTPNVPSANIAALRKQVVPPTLAWPNSISTSVFGEPPGGQPQQRREVSVEELIDLEQQAEFFIVLGQDEAAIDLLMGHLRGTSGDSPLPYLKLLEIYKRRGERKAYDRLRESFNSRFSTLAPDWDADVHEGRSLEDYPAVTQRLEGLWARPRQAMDVLQATLLRPAGDAVASENFDLPAYRELMLLYAVARDRAEAESSESVDLLLPLSEGADDQAPQGSMFERLMATTTLEAQPSAMKPMDVDLHLEMVEQVSLAPKQGPAGSEGKPPEGTPRE